MWFSFRRSRDRLSLDELRYLTDQLKKVQIVNEVNKDFVIEALRSISELITYGDQHDPAYFEFFMESQVMGDFVRILKISRTMTISLQLLQTMSIMIQNLKSKHAIYYMFSNEHINYLITYSFDFRNDEIISYYISFLRAISGKLDKNTISLLVKIKNDEVISFPLYVEAIRFAFHEESMIRTAIRALTLNVYHVGDDCVNRFVATTPRADYFSHLVKFFQKQCIGLNALVYENLRNTRQDAASAVIAAVDEIEDNLFYISDVISAGIPDVGRLITENMLQLLIIPLLLPSLRTEAVNEVQIGALTSLYLLCCILRIVKIKDLAHAIAAALLMPLQSVRKNVGTKLNGFMSDYGTTHDSHQPDSRDPDSVKGESPNVIAPSLLDLSQVHIEDASSSDSHVPLREALLSYITNGDDVHVSGSLCVLATLLQTKELDESMLDALGILPQRKQHKKLLLQALVGEESGEEQLFSTESSLRADGISSELDSYLRRLKDQYGVSYCFPEVGASPRVHKYQVLDALVNLFCRSNISAETLWDGGWLLRQLLPYSEAEFNSNHLKLLKESYKNRTSVLLQEIRGIWSDLVITVLCDEWKKCKRVIEGPSPRREPKFVLLPLQSSSPEDGVPGEPSLSAGQKMLELVKVFVLLHQLLGFSLGKALPEQPPIHPPIDVPENSRAKTAGLGLSIPKPGTEVRLVDAVPCRIAFERGKERHFCFLAISVGTSGWLVLAEESPLRKNSGVVRVCAPLAGSNPRIDEKHSRWLHLRIRPATLPCMDCSRFNAYAKVKTKALVDGRWTLAFKDEESCKLAASMILEEINLQSKEVERRLEPLFDFERTSKSVSHSEHPLYA